MSEEEEEVITDGISDEEILDKDSEENSDENSEENSEEDSDENSDENSEEDSDDLSDGDSDETTQKKIKKLLDPGEAERARQTDAMLYYKIGEFSPNFLLTIPIKFELRMMTSYSEHTEEQ